MISGAIGWFVLTIFVLGWVVAAWTSSRVEFMTHAARRWFKSHPIVAWLMFAIWLFLGLHFYPYIPI